MEEMVSEDDALGFIFRKPKPKMLHKTPEISVMNCTWRKRRVRINVHNFFNHNLYSSRDKNFSISPWNNDDIAACFKNYSPMISGEWKWNFMKTKMVRIFCWLVRWFIHHKKKHNSLISWGSFFHKLEGLEGHQKLILAIIWVNFKEFRCF